MAGQYSMRSPGNNYSRRQNQFDLSVVLTLVSPVAVPVVTDTVTRQLT